MNWYCKKCKKMHSDEEMCPYIKIQLKEHPEWIGEISDFTVLAGEERLITTQALDGVARSVNKLTGTQLSYEGTHQFARDIQVFKRLHIEKKLGANTLSTPQVAREHFLRAGITDTGATQTWYESQLTGYGQETDWLIRKRGEISSLWQKSELLEGNAAGVDGVTVNRFTGKEINRVTIKASKNPMTKNSKGIKDVQEAIKKGTATEKDTIFGPVGTEKAARDAGLINPVEEQNTYQQIENSNERLVKKVLDEKAVLSPTAQQVLEKATQGAIVGAAVAITVSSITTYIRYKNGELTIEEAFTDIGEDTMKGAIVGGAMGAITIFLPAGVLGFAAGMAIGVYLNATCTNILDEVFGKGAFGEILSSSGYVYGMTFNLADYYKKINENIRQTEKNILMTKQEQNITEANFAVFEEMKG